MDPSTGTFISMDSYAGSLSDPISLHKYLYANANPVMNTDPSGYFSLCECMVAVGQRISMINQKIHQIRTLQKLMNLANAACTAYDMLTMMKEVWLGEKTIVDVALVLLRGIAIGYLINCACATQLGVVLKPVMAALGVKSNVDELVEAIKNKDVVEIVVRSVQLVCAIFGMTAQCFTGDTLVSTENGLIPIEDLREGDLVWTESIETGEQELKPVTKVFVNKTDRILHLTVLTDSGNETIIDTTEGHPFYVEGKGWVKATYLEEGDILRKEDVGYATVVSSWIEETAEPVYTYNLNVQDNHTYYVSEDKVLVHNNGNADCSIKTDDEVDVELKYKEGWTEAQKAAADAKVKALTDANTIKTKVSRGSRSASSRYKSALGNNSVPSGYDVDHTIDLQLGGVDDILNMNPLDASVNRSLGAQIMHIIKKYEVGTIFGEFKIK
ncbi:MAG: Hint domain-containing protein [Eubacterium sp.]|nr:Hint domain-containing protein [Eubacterium sp.]